MLAVALHLRDQELSLRQIAERLVISTGKKKAGTRQQPPSRGCSATAMTRRWKLLVTDGYFAAGRGFRSSRPTHTVRER
ncbi:hypothetical protein ACFFWE_01555 [Sphaerisporangium melleum]|uniref:hypothetical protein n=1 Tax=Sphaerisporangium melleum TaxID=321316 RepID=UPI0016644D3E|nr:hypothetical protein [Sphaerisporangium melleum]